MNAAETPPRHGAAPHAMPHAAKRFVAALAWLALASTLVPSTSACSTAPHADAIPKRPRGTVAARAPAPTPPRSGATLDYLERCLHASCDARLPTLVVIHGLGDSPEAFVSLYDGVSVPVRVIALRAPLPWNDGFAWFPYRARASSPAEIGAALAALVPRVGATLDAICATRTCDPRVVVSGFSQGGMMSYALAALAPGRFVAAVPVSGMLPIGLDPVAAARRPRIIAFHGASDSVVPAELDVAGSERLRAAGYAIELELEPGVGHTISATTRARALGSIDAALR